MSALPCLMVNMPFSSPQFPSIQVGLLKAIAQRAGLTIDVEYANLRFAKLMGLKLYDFFVHHRGPLVSEWMFSVAAFGEDKQRDIEFCDRYQSLLSQAAKHAGVSIQEILCVRLETIPAEVAGLADEIVKRNYSVVCFTSTFQQNVASLALARALKSRNPQIRTIFGGANFDGEMGPAYVEAFPEIDFAIVGEADSVFPQLLRIVLAGGSTCDIAGVISRDRFTPVGGKRATYDDAMDLLPVPDYEDYFLALRRLDLSGADLGRPSCLLFEGSRGCWWGEKHHCKFCGLNGQGMGYRRKSAQRVADEVACLTSKHRVARINAVDNILDHKQMAELLNLLAQREFDIEIFYEVKANLTRREIEMLADAGVREVQPGIESLSSHVLKLMDKGITALQNLNAIRWFCYYGIYPHWNLLYGFPGEVVADFQLQAELFPAIRHLPPPKGVGQIWLERFSPYLMNPVDRAHFSNVRPQESYRYVYPAELDIERAAYFFEGELNSGVDKSAVDQMLVAVADWKTCWEGESLPFLVLQKFDGGVRVIDGRADSINPLYIFYRGLAAKVLLACMDAPISRPSILRVCGLDADSSLDTEAVEDILRALVGRRFLAQEGTKYLSLPLPLRKGRRVRSDTAPA